MTETLLSHLGAKVNAFQWYWPPSWIDHFRFLPISLNSVDICPMELPDPENIRIAVGIALLSSIGTEIQEFQ